MKRIRIRNRVSEMLDAALTVPSEPSQRVPGNAFHPQVETGDAAWEERMARQRRDWREQDNRKFYNPEHAVPASQDPDDNDWNVYVWTDIRAKPMQEPRSEWVKVGTRHKKKGRRKPMTMNRLFAIIRQKFNVERDTPVLLVSPRDDKGDHPAPKHRDTLRPWTPPKEALATKLAPKQKVTKIRKNVSPKLELVPVAKRADGTTAFTFKTRYVAWGRTGPKHPWYYLGPCESMTKRDSLRETQKRFPIHSEIVVVDVKSMSYSLRNRIRTGSIVAGATKMEPPNV